MLHTMAASSGEPNGTLPLLPGGGGRAGRESYVARCNVINRHHACAALQRLVDSLVPPERPAATHKV